MNWIQNTLDNVNKDFKQKEEFKKINLKKYGKLDKSIKWSMTNMEISKLATLAKATRGYPADGVPRSVIGFARDIAEGRDRKYTVLEHTPDNIMSYVNASDYWEIKEAVVDNIKNVYAKNDDLQCVICYFRKKYILTTYSSFEEIKKHISNQIRTGTFDAVVKQEKKKRKRLHEFDYNADDFRQPYITNNLDMSKYTY